MAPIEGRSAILQAIENVRNARRALAVEPCEGMCPHPYVVALAEMRNALAYINQVQK